MKRLWPPLAVIEADLLEPSYKLVQRWSDGESLPAALIERLEQNPKARRLRDALQSSSATSDVTTADSMPRATTEAADSVQLEDLLPLPEPFAQVLSRRIAVNTATFSTLPKAGQIVRIDEVRGPNGPLPWDLSRPLAALLGEPTETIDVWYGWLVSAETDYASYWDLLLEEQDRPYDPLAGMVQVWNPVHVYLPSIGGVLAELSSERLAAVRALALECLTAAEPDSIEAQPGETLVRTIRGHVIRTGTPLGDASATRDPRWRYQVLYGAATEALKTPARLALQAAAKAIETRFWESLKTLPNGLRDIVTGIREWASGREIDFGPALAQPMAGTTTAGGSLAAYDLYGLLRLGFGTRSDRYWRLHLQLLADRPLVIHHFRGAREIAMIRLQNANAQTLLDVASGGQDRLLVTEAGAIEPLEIPLGKRVDPTG